MKQPYSLELRGSWPKILEVEHVPQCAQYCNDLAGCMASPPPSELGSYVFTAFHRYAPTILTLACETLTFFEIKGNK
jgi:hypothetical protein